MKRALNISVSFLLIATLLVSYAGIPIFKMVCGTEGKLVVSMQDMRGSCRHKESPAKKSCCSHDEQKPVVAKTSCCEYSHNLLRLEEVTPVNESQTTTGIYLTSVALVFPDISFANSLVGFARAYDHYLPTHRLKPKQSPQSIFQSFLI